MRKWCDTSKGKDKTMCYYMGVGDAESVRERTHRSPHDATRHRHSPLPPPHL